MGPCITISDEFHLAVYFIGCELLLLFVCLRRALPKVQGGTALMMAAHQGHTDCVRLLVEAGADTEAKDFVRHVINFFQLFVYHFMVTDSHC